MESVNQSSRFYSEKRFLTVLFLCLFVMESMCLLVCGPLVANELPSDVVVNLQCRNKKLGVLLKELAEKNGYHVQVSKKLSTILVTGRYLSVNFDDFLRRVLRKENYSLIVDQEKKTIRLVSLGVRKNTKNQLIGKSNYIFDVTGNHFDAVQVRKEQNEKLVTAKKFNDSVEPVSNIKYSKIKEVQSIQDRFLQEYLDNPDAVEPVTGISLSVINKIQKKQELILHRIEQNNDVVDPATGLPYSMLEKIHKKQESALLKQINSHNTGVSFSDKKDVPVPRTRM